MIRGGALEKAVAIWHKPIPETHKRTSTLSLLMDAARYSEVPCKVAGDGVTYDVAEYWYMRDTKGAVGTSPPTGQTYDAARRVAVIDVKDGRYCWVDSEPGIQPVAAGKGGRLLPDYAVNILHDAGIR
jgi:hypothetical protein